MYEYRILIWEALREHIYKGTLLEKLRELAVREIEFLGIDMPALNEVTVDGEYLVLR